MMRWSWQGQRWRKGRGKDGTDDDGISKEK